MLETHGIPAGLTVSLHRARIRLGMEDEATRWMQMLNDRHREAVATLDRERMAIEIVFRSSEPTGDHLTWITARGPGEDVGTSRHALDIDHLDYDRRVRLPGWTIGEVQLLLLPEPVLRAVTDWAGVPEGT
ncbi:hypothetical protein ITJ38_13010 [Agreia pratensis]|uniref:DUF6176 family protein n=1 Tax=Agreia pratensis TaxID=150121 RepID=UPI00188D4371|nr:DUF6176 family protein [Agreia pratensis]MBF4635327.1 hypothetical protein [Agreia pratensis]